MFENVSTVNTANPAEILAPLLTDEMMPVLVGYIIGGLLLAFFGYKLLKIESMILGAALGFGLGYSLLGPLVTDLVQGVDLAIILGLACMVILALLAFKIYKALLVIVGAAFGFSIPLIIMFAFEVEPVIIYIVSAVIGVIAGFLTLKLFKPIYIFSSSMYGMMLVFVSLSLLIFKDNVVALLIAELLGFGFGIFAMVKQFKMNSDK